MQVNYVVGTQKVLRPGLLPSPQANKRGQRHLLWELEPQILSRGHMPQPAGPAPVDRCPGLCPMAGPICPHPDVLFSVSELTTDCRCKYQIKLHPPVTQVPKLASSAHNCVHLLLLNCSRNSLPPCTSTLRARDLADTITTKSFITVVGWMVALRRTSPRPNP